MILQLCFQGHFVTLGYQLPFLGECVRVRSFRGQAFAEKPRV